MLSAPRNETEVVAQIERLALEARSIRRRIEHAQTPADKRVLNRQLAEIDDRILRLRTTLR